MKYLLNSVTEPMHARVIQKAQERMLERVTAVPEKRAAGVRRLSLPRTQARNIVAGRFDTGSGSCRDPYDSPQAGEEKGRPCTSFHACFRCPNGLWFLEDLPQVIATRNRFVSFRDDMKAADWETVYGESVRIINEDIIPAFRSEQIQAATDAAEGMARRPMIVAREFYHEPADRLHGGISGSEAGRSRWKSGGVRCLEIRRRSMGLLQ